MGNAVAVPRNPPELHDLVGRKSTINRTCAPHGGNNCGMDSLFLMWRFCPDPHDGNVITCIAVNMAAFKKFNSTDCYVALHIYPAKGLSHSDGLGSSASNGSLTGSSEDNGKNTSNVVDSENTSLHELVCSSSANLTPRGLAASFGPVLISSNREPVGYADGALEFDIYLWHGQNSGKHTKAVALTRSMDLERHLAKDQLLLHLWCSDGKISLGSAVVDDLAQFKDGGRWNNNHLLSHLLKRHKNHKPANSYSFLARGEWFGPSPKVEIKVPDFKTIPEKKLPASMSMPLSPVAGQTAPPIAKPKFSLALKQIPKTISQPLSAKDELAVCEDVASQITEHVFLGGIRPSQNRNILKAANITHIINCIGNLAKNSFPDELKYKTYTLADMGEQDIECVLYDAFDFMEEVLQQGGRVYVHCEKGVSRSASLVIGYLMWKNKNEFQKTHEYVKTKRIVASPNPGFISQLITWYKRINNISQQARFFKFAPIPTCEGELPLIAPKIVPNFTIDAVDRQSCFVLHTPATVFLWVGAQCPENYLLAARRFITQLQKYENATKSVVELKPTPEEEEFWKHMLVATLSLSPRNLAQSIPNNKNPISPRSNSGPLSPRSSKPAQLSPRNA